MSNFAGTILKINQLRQTAKPYDIEVISDLITEDKKVNQFYLLKQMLQKIQSLIIY